MEGTTTVFAVVFITSVVVDADEASAVVVLVPAIPEFFSISLMERIVLAVPGLLLLVLLLLDNNHSRSSTVKLCHRIRAYSS